MSIFVNMTDRFMSGWGLARGRSHLCIECDTIEQAEAVERAARDRGEMKRIAIASKPRRARPGDHVSVKSFADMGGPWLRYWPGARPKAATKEA